MNNKAKLSLFILLCLLTSLTSNVLAEDQNTGVTAITEYVREIGYGEYLDSYISMPRPDQEIVIPGWSYTKADMDLKIVPGFDGYDDIVMITDESGYVEWSFEVEEAGLYNLSIMYYPVEGRGIDIERALMINGERPFDNARYFKFPRIWGDSGKMLVDSMGNQIRPPQAEKPQWIESNFIDYLGYVEEPYYFYFEEGINTIGLESRMEPMAIGHLKLYQYSLPPSYETVAANYQENGYKTTEDIFLKVQGEESVRRSDQTLFGISDHGDPTVEPYHHAEIRLNSIGGYRWSQPGQWIEWEVDVPEAGLYKLAFKAKQNEKVGSYSTRAIKINGEIPFAEVMTVPFNYSTYYEMNTISDPETAEPYLFYLEPGINKIQLEVRLGSIAEILRLVEEHLYELNTIYRRIIMITGRNPDPLRTYELNRRIPDVIERINFQANIFEELAQRLIDDTGMEGEHTDMLTRIVRLLRRMYNDPDRIPPMLSELRDNLGSLGTWIYETREQPLQIDYLIVASPEQEMPQAEPTFYQSFVHEVKAIIASFFRDYDLVGDMPGEYEARKDIEPLVVWMGSGRDQAQVLKQLIDNDFSPKTGIPVQLQLIPDLSQLLIRAAIAGTGPDIAIGLQVQDPVNFGMRGALYNLAEFDDFDEIMTRFKSSSIVPFSYRDQVFALAAQQSFPMMFYRTDILAELGIEPPKTWDDVYQILPVLQKNGMSIGINSTMFQTMLYQKNELLYKPDGVETNLDSEVAIQTFTDLTELFSLYSLLITYNAENRFRLGEMPIVIEDYGLYNRLQVFAPELRGEWSFDLVPGTRQPDGSIDHTVAAPIVNAAGSSNPMALAQAGIQGPATTIMSNASDPEIAWEFVKWWTSEEIQIQFGRELESLMGSAARYPTSNVDAFEQLPWSVEERAKLLEQWEWVEGTLEVPGGYYTSRMYDWAFRAVVIEMESPRETLMKYNNDINYEIALKRKEFGLEQTLDEVSKENIDLFWSRLRLIDRKDQY